MEFKFGGPVSVSRFIPGFNVVSVFCFVARFQCRFQSGFIVPVSKPFQRSGFRVGFKAVSMLTKWPGFKFGFKVCFSIGIFPNTDDVLFQTGFRGVSMSTRPVSESSCPERGSTPVSDLVSKYGFRFSFRLWFQSRAVK